MQIEVKRSAPRRGEGNDRGGFRGGRGGGHNSFGGGGGHQSFGQNSGSNNNNNSGGNNMMMGGMPGMGGMMMPGFDPNAMAEYFKNMGWGQWNPMMMMNPMMMGQMGGMASGGMMMPGMQAAAGSGSPSMGQSSNANNHSSSRSSEAKSLSPPPNAPVGHPSVTTDREIQSDPRTRTRSLSHRPDPRPDRHLVLSDTTPVDEATTPIHDEL